MMKSAITFFCLGLIAILLGANGVAGLSIELGKTLLIVFLIMSVLSFLAGTFSGHGNSR